MKPYGVTTEITNFYLVLLKVKVFANCVDSASTPDMKFYIKISLVQNLDRCNMILCTKRTSSISSVEQIIYFVW